MNPNQPNRWALAVSLAAALILIAAIAIHEGRSIRRLPVPEPEGLVVTPTGDEVPRLAPIRVTFPTPPAVREPARLLRLDPSAPGRYVWIGERTLQYTPDYPGLLRGQQYTVAVAPDPQAGVPAGHTAQFTTEGVLKVESVIPGPGETEVPRNAQVLVQFSRAVAPLTVLSESASGGDKPVLQITPPLRGKGEWLNTSLYRFIPEELDPISRYAVTVPAGLTAAADGVLKEDFQWHFVSVGPALASVSPDRNTQFAGLNQPVVVTFTQSMKADSVEAGFQLRASNGEVIPGSFAWSDDGMAATFTPAGRLAPDASYEIVVPAGLDGLQGGRTAVEWRSTFRTVGLPRIVSTVPASGATNAARFGVQFQFSNPMDQESVESWISVSGLDTSTSRHFWGGPEGRMLNLNVTLQPSTSYTVTLRDGAVDRYGQPLGPHSFSFMTGALPSSVSFAVPNQFATYSTGNDPKLYYHAINLPAVSFRLFHLTRDEALSLHRGRGGDLSRFTPSRPAMRLWTERASGDLNEVVLASTSLSGGGPLPPGDYFVTSGGDFRSVLAFSVVNTALITKFSNDELLVWALDHETGGPLADVELNAEGPGVGAPAAATDSRGLASFPFRRDRFGFGGGQVIVTLDDGDHRGIAVSGWQQGSQPYQLGIPFEPFPREYVGHLYTDRPIYRPGEEVHFKGVLRLDDDAAYQLPPANTRLAVLLQSAGRRDLSRQEVVLNEFGTFAGTFSLSTESGTGDHNLSVMLADSLPPPGGPARSPFSITIASTPFMVAEFRKPEFQVQLVIARSGGPSGAGAGDEATRAGQASPGFVSGDSIEANAEASFFFGGPVAGAKARWSVMASPQPQRFAGFERYSFSDFDYYRPAVVREPVRAQGAGTTDASGRLAFSVPAIITGNEGPQRYQISAAVTGDSAQEVASSTTVTVHPAELYTGIRPARYLATAGEEATIELVTVDTEGRPLPGRAIEVKVYQREWITVKEQTPDGARRYRSEPRDTLLTTLRATTDAKALATVRHTPRAAGSLRFAAEATDRGGRVARSAAFLWVGGSGYARWQITNDDTLQLVADKDSYKVGDVAEVLVPSPYDGMTGLVTVERGRIISRAVQQFPGNSERIRIPIEENHVPNVFISVVLYRPPSAGDPIPRYKVGYVKLPVSTETRSLTVAVQPNRDLTRPGETLRYDIRVTDAAGKGVRSEVSVAVVDKAVLSLAEDRATTGLKAFWFERGLGVTTASSLAVSVDRSNDVIGEARLGGKGGGGLDDERLREEFRNTALWRPQLATAEDGTASIELTVPDNLTTWRAHVRAVSGDTQVGEAASEIVSTQPLLLRPALPRFLRVGDKATLRTLVRNGTRAGAQVQVSLAAEGLQLCGAGAPGCERTRRATVAAGQSAMFEWPVEAVEDGVATLTFSAIGPGELRDAVVQELPVHLSVTPETTATGGVVGAEPRSEVVFLPHYALQKGGKVEVSAQSTLVGSLREELEAMQHRPWEGPDRIAARLLAAAGVRRAEPRVRDSLTSDGALDADVARLAGAQRSDGGWAWCPTACPSDPRVTANVLLALAEARRQGREVTAALNRAGAFLDRELARPRDVVNGVDPNERAFLLYAIAASSSSNRAAVLALQEQYRERLSNSGRAHLVLALRELGMEAGDGPLAQTLADLNAAMVASANGNHWEDPTSQGGKSTYSGGRTTSLVLLALVRVSPDHPLIEETARWLGAGRESGGYRDARSILALGEYMARTGELGAEYAYRADLNGREAMSGRFAGSAALPQKKELPLSLFPLGQPNLLTFTRDFAQPGRLYYGLNLRYFTPGVGIESLNRGLAVSHEYSALEDPGRAVVKARLGDTVRVKVTVVVPHDLTRVVVHDLLPAGLEPVDTRLKITDAATAARLEEDRRRGLPNQPNGRAWAPWYTWYYSPWRHVDIRDDRITLYADRLPRGLHEYVYYARATSIGDYFVAPAHGEDTHFPEVFGRSDSGRFTVEP